MKTIRSTFSSARLFAISSARFFAVLTALLWLSACGTTHTLLQSFASPQEQVLQETTALRKAGNPAMAVSMLQTALGQFPDDPTLLQALGNALIENGKPDDAIRIFDQLIAKDATNALAYSGKAVALDHQGNHRRARTLYKKALALQPDSLTILNNLAMSWILSGKPQEAIALLEPLVNAENTGTPHNLTVRHNLALAYGVSGQADKANALNQRDMTPEQAADNQRFYDQYMASHARDVKTARSISTRSTPAKKKALPPTE